MREDPKEVAKAFLIFASEFRTPSRFCYAFVVRESFFFLGVASLMGRHDV